MTFCPKLWGEAKRCRELSKGHGEMKVRVHYTGSAAWYREAEQLMASPYRVYLHLLLDQLFPQQHSVVSQARTSIQG